MAKVVMRAGKVFILIFIPILIVLLLGYVFQKSSIAQVSSEISVAKESEQINVEQLLKTIDLYRSGCKYEEMENLCLGILSQYPDSKSALHARQGLVELYIEIGNDNKAEESIDTLISEFGQNKSMARSLCEIGDVYRRMRKFDKADNIYKLIVSNNKEDSFSIWAQKNLCTMYAQKREKSSFNTVVDELKEKYSQDDNYGRALCDIADACRDAKWYYKAVELYHDLTNNYSNIEHVIWSQKNLCLLHISQNQYDKADIELERLEKVFSKNKFLVRAILEVGHGWRQAKEYDRAIAIYSWIYETYPQNEMALWAQKDLISLLIEQKKVDASSNINNIRVKYNSDARFIQILCEIADAYQRAGQLDKAVNIFREIVTRYPKNEYAVWSQKNLCTLYIDSGDIDSANSEIEKLLNDFQGRDQLPQALLDISDAWRSVKDYTNADEINRYIIGIYAGTNHAFWATQKIISNKILQSEDVLAPPQDVPSEIIVAIDQFIIDYASYPNLTQAVFMIGEEYYILGHEDCLCKPKPGQEDKWPKVIKIWEKVINELPIDRRFTPRTWFLTGVCYSYLKNDEAAVPYIEEVLDVWPDFEWAWSAQVWLGDCYRHLKRDKILDSSEADPLIEKAYKGIIEKYSDSSLVECAYWRLSNLKYENRNWADAALYTELFLDQDVKDARVPGILNRLGRTYEKMGEKEFAQNTYRRVLSDYSDDIEAVNKANARLLVLEGGAK